MARAGRHDEPPLIEVLRAEGARFEFVQAVRILEILRPFAARPGTAVHASEEAVRFRAAISLAFPTSDIVRVELPGDPAREQPVLDVNFMSLAGVQGPLPRSVTELILRRLQSGDRAFRDFLDIFHHRLVSFAYRARLERRPGLETRLPHDTAGGRVLAALAGAASPHARRALGLHMADLLATAGLRAGPRRTLNGLERLLRVMLSVPVRVLPFEGRWCDVEPPLQARLTRNGPVPRLGSRAVLGRRMWDQTAGVRVRVGPLSLDRFLDLLPDGAGHGAMARSFRGYAGPRLDARVELLLHRHQRPTAILRSSTASREAGAAHRTAAPSATGGKLGWTTWLRGSGRSPADPGVTVRLRAPAPTSA